MEELNSPNYIWNKPASEETGHMLNCHSPIVSDELSWLCSWLLTTILFMSLTYAALAVITAFCKPSPTLDLRTNHRPAKSTELLTDFQSTGRNTTKDWKGIKRNCSTFETCMIKNMRNIQPARHESSTQCLLGICAICAVCCHLGYWKAYGKENAQRESIHPQHLGNIPGVYLRYIIPGI